MKLEFKVMEDVDFMDGVIQERQDDINTIGRIMGDLKEITSDFVLEVDAQGSKLEDLESNMGTVASNTGEATKQINQANERSRSNGRCMLIIVII